MKKDDLDGFKREDRSTIVIDLTKGIDHIWNDINSKCRADIRKAEKEPIETNIDDNYENFIELNRRFRNIKGLDSNEFSLDYMKKYCTLLSAKFDGKTVAGILFISDGTRMRGLIAANARLDSPMAKQANIAKINRLLWWEAIRYGREKGISLFDMGGYYTGPEPNIQLEGVNEFKRRFGGTVIGDYYYTKNYTYKVRLAKETLSLIQWVKRPFNKYASHKVDP